MKNDTSSSFDHAAETLRFPAVLDLIARRCVSESARRKISGLGPGRRVEEIRAALAQIEEYRLFHEKNGDLPLTDTAYATDVELARQRNATLEPRQLLSIASAERTVLELKNILEKNAGEYALLAGMAAGLTAHRELIKAVEKAIDSDGKIKDDASPELRSIRRNTQRSRGALRGLTEKLTAGLGEGAYPTILGSRYVVLIPRTHFRRNEGLVHAASQKGASLYFEPFALVEKNNELETLLGDEKAEEARILREINESVRASAPGLSRNAGVLDDLDCLRAKAAFAREFGCVSPAVAPIGAMRLVDARHPLLVLSLENSQNAGEVVPLNVEIRKNEKVMVITGPNAGGKTVSLKTVGTAALLFQCGLQVPCARGTELPVFDDIFADIGDEQSIETSLSTFTSHLAHLDRMCREAGPRSLCLIDEIGDGTDPEEGSALAVATLERLLSAGAIVVATTHYGRIKTFALKTEGIGNASMAFEDAEGKPLYRLLQGIAGRSRGIETARRTGFSPEIIAKAEEYLGDEAFQLEGLLSELERSHVALEQERESLARRFEELGSLVERFTAKEAEFNVSKSEADRKATREAEEFLLQTRREIEQLVKAIREEQARKEVLRRTRAKLDSMIKTVRKRRETEVPPGRPAGEVAPGDRVSLNPSGEPSGLVISAENGVATVEINNKRIKIDIKGLYKAPLESKSPPKSVFYDVQIEPLASTSVDVRGSDREQALEEVNRFVDRAVLSGVREICIIHGVGEGILSRAIRDYLEADSRVEATRPGGLGEGGLGVTIATLK